MRTLETDVVIVGAGTAGLNARRAVAAAGKRWVMVERGAYGTMCARVGCMPSKLLIAAAERHHDITTAGLFGIDVPSDRIRIDGKAVMARVQRERDRFVGFVLDANERLPKEQNLRGAARFAGPTTILVDDEWRIETRATVIATGSRPVIPTELEVLGDRLLTNDSVFELPDLPRSLAVIGVGVIGLELGQAFHRLGVRTMLLARRGGISGLGDPAVLARANDHFRAALDLREGVVVGAERTAGGARLTWKSSSGTTDSAELDYVLSATGRVPNLGGLGLETTGLALGRGGVPVSDPETLQCEEAPIFIAGDVAGHRAVLHEAADEGRIAGENAARFPDTQKSARRVPLEVTFSDPNIARVGRRFAELDPQATAIGEVSFDNQGRSRMAGKNVGLMRLYGSRADRRLLGSEMFGPRMEHLAHLLAWSIQAGLTVDQMLAMPFYHPVFEEGLRTGLQSLARAY